MSPPVWSSSWYWKPPKTESPWIPGGANGIDEPARDPHQRPADPVEHGLQRVVLAVPLVVVLEPREDEAVVRARRRLKLKPTTEKAARMSGSLNRIASACLAISVV